MFIRKYAPAGVVANSDGDILQYLGKTTLYLKPPPNNVKPNLLKLAHSGLIKPLRALLHLANKSGSPVRTAVLHVKLGRQTKDLHLSVIPVLSAAPKERRFLVTFERAAKVRATQPMAVE